jgi:large subunit ribosomal protein L10
MAEKTQKIQPHKVEAVQQIRRMVEDSRDLIFTDYRGLTVTQITELRRALAERQAEYRVIKNNYGKLALSELGLSYEDEFLVDPTALALVKSDIGPVAKLLFDFSRETTLKIKGGLIDRRVTSAAEVEAISALPGREQLLARLMWVAKGPVAQLLYVLGGVTSKLVRTLQAVAEQKK